MNGLTVTQEELERVLRARNVYNTLAFDLRAKLDEGAPVEEGPLGAQKTEAGTIGTFDHPDVDRIEILGVHVGPTEAEKQELPGWFKTAEEDFTLTHWGTGGDAFLTIRMTRDEFIELKRCLARLRGYALPPAA